jgi:regulator of ribosome biosynthesis
MASSSGGGGGDESSGVRATELIKLDTGLLLIQNGQEFVPGSDFEAQLRARATSGVQALFNRLFTLPATRATNGAVVELGKPHMRIPRVKPVPAEKVETRWEKYARIKGIKKTKKSKLDWDVEKQEWRPRSGYQKANDDADRWVIEDKTNESARDPTFDPFRQMKADKKARVDKQMSAQKANAAVAQAEQTKKLRAKRGGGGGGATGTRERLGAVISLDAPKTETPFGQGAVRRAAKIKAIDQVTMAAQESTASIGIFDSKLKRLGEKSVRGKRQRFDPLVPASSSDEKERNLKVLRRVTHKTTDDAAVDVTAAVKLQKAKDRVTGRRTGVEARKPLDTSRRSKFGRLHKQ